MKLTIKIECESIGQFQQHLLSMFEATVIYLHEEDKKEDGVSDVDEFASQAVNGANILDDNNCYGHRVVEMSRVG